MSLEQIFLWIFGVFAVCSIYFGRKHFSASSSKHKAIKDQLKLSHGLLTGSFSSLKSSDGCDIWFSTPDRDFVNGVATFGCEVLQPPVRSSVSISKECPDLFNSEFMLLNKGRLNAVMGYEAAAPDTFSKDIHEKFHIIAKKPGLTPATLIELEDKTAKLLQLLKNYRRYEIIYRSNRLSVFIGVESINTHSDLVPVYERTMECMRYMQNISTQQSAA